MKPTAIERNFLTVSQIANRLKVSERTVLNWIDKKELEAEPLDPGRQRTVWIAATAEVDRFEHEYTEAKKSK